MNIFSYESKFSQVLMFVADLCILNVVFLVCCLPIFTIGAAQAALYSGIRTLLDKETDESPVKAFFKAFPVGFKQITLGWGVAALVTVLFAYVTMLVSAYGEIRANAPVWMSVIALALFMLWSSQIPLFHARFSCSVKQLWRNSLILMILHPLRSILVTALLWLPAILVLAKPFVFMAATPAWLLLYYAVAFMLNFFLMKKPFERFIAEASPKKEEPAETEEKKEPEEIEA